MHVAVLVAVQPLETHHGRRLRQLLLDIPHLPIAMALHRAGVPVGFRRRFARAAVAHAVLFGLWPLVLSDCADTEDGELLEAAESPLRTRSAIKAVSVVCVVLYASRMILQVDTCKVAETESIWEAPAAF